MSLIKKIAQKRVLTKHKKKVDLILSYDSRMAIASDEEVIEYAREIAKTKTYSPLSLAAIREAAFRTVGLRAYGVQMLGVLATLDGMVLDMKTGEGKTLVAAISAVALSFTNTLVRVATANTYLASRDYEWMKPLFNFLNVKSSLISDSCSSGVVYSTLNEFCLQWLNDHLVFDVSELSHTSFLYNGESEAIIIDEIDYTLIDSSTVPYAITGTVMQDSNGMKNAISIAKSLSLNDESKYLDSTNEQSFKESFYDDALNLLVSLSNVKDKSEFLTKYCNDLYNVKFAYIALVLMKKGKDYIVKNNQVLRIDRRTGRAYPNGFNESLLMALQLIEGVSVTRTNIELVTSTLPNYIKRYRHISGMSGSAIANKNELKHIYNLDVIGIQTNEKCKRKDGGYRLFETIEGKMEHALSVVREHHKKGRPILVSCESDKQSIDFYKMLSNAGISSQLLNSYNVEDELNVFSNAGMFKSITVTTKLCGRGTDISLKSNENDKDYINNELGGLLVLGLGAGETPVDDIQLIGRAGRQGENGESLMLVSLEDEIFSTNKLAQFSLKSCIWDDECEKAEREKSKALSHAVKQSQLVKQSAQKDIRNQLMLFDKPVAIHLDILMKKRLEILSVGKPIEYLRRLAEKCDFASEDLNRLFQSIDKSYKCLEAEKIHSICTKSLNKTLTDLWKGHSISLSHVRAEAISSCNCSGGLFKYQERCQQQLCELSNLLNKSLVVNAIEKLEMESNYVELANQFLSRNDAAKLASIQQSY